MIISSIDLFFSLDCAAGVGPEVDAPRFGLPAVALVGSVFFVVGGLSVDAGAGRKLEAIDDDAAPAKDKPLAAGAGTVGFSVGLPMFANRSVVEDAEVAIGVEPGATVDELVVWPPRSNKLFAFVVEVVDSPGFEVK